MRHLEALAIALVFAIAASQMLTLTAHQVAPVHHASAQRAVAWALLNSRSAEELVELLQLSLGDKVAALWLDGRLLAGGPGSSPMAVCYAAVKLDSTPVPPGYMARNVTVCVRP